MKKPLLQRETKQLPHSLIFIQLQLFFPEVFPYVNVQHPGFPSAFPHWRTSLLVRNKKFRGKTGKVTFTFMHAASASKKFQYNTDGEPGITS